MRMPKRPDLDLATPETHLVGQIRRERAREGTRRMPRLNGTEIQRRAPVRKNHNVCGDISPIGPLQVRDLRVEPGEIRRVRLVVRADVPAGGMVEIIEPDAHRSLVFRGDAGEEAAAEDDHVGAGQPERGAVEEDEFTPHPPGYVTIADVSFKRAQDVEGGGPAGMICFVVPRDEEYGAEAGELAGEEGEAGVLVRGDVAHVAEEGEVGCSGHDVEDVVGLWGFQVQVGEDLDRQFGVLIMQCEHAKVMEGSVF